MHAMSIRSFLLACILLPPGAAQAHDLQYNVSGGQAVVIHLHEDNEPFTFEGYEIYRAGENCRIRSAAAIARAASPFSRIAPGNGA